RTAVIPAANVPYTTSGLAALNARGVATHADFVCNAGAVMGYRSPHGLTPPEVLADVERRIAALVHEAASHPAGPYAGACAMAEAFLGTWREPEALPDGPPLA